MHSGSTTQRNMKEQNEYWIFVRVQHEEENINKKQSHIVGTVQNCNRKFVERVKVDIPKTKYITAHFPALVQARQ